MNINTYQAMYAQPQQNYNYNPNQMYYPQQHTIQVIDPAREEEAMKAGSKMGQITCTNLILISTTSIIGIILSILTFVETGVFNANKEILEEAFNTTNNAHLRMGFQTHFGKLAFSCALIFTAFTTLIIVFNICLYISDSTLNFLNICRKKQKKEEHEPI